MKAMILAAGKGTRLQPLTYELPKPMIPILGRPVMAFLIEHLAKHGVTQIMVNVSHLHEKIESYFGDGSQYGVQIGYSFEGYINDGGTINPQPVGSAGGLRKIQDFGNFFDDTTIVLCGDALIDLDLSAALAEHRSKGAIATVITKEVGWDKVSSYGVVLTEDDGKIVSFQEKPTQAEARSNLASTGIYIFEPEVLDLVPADTVYDIGSQLFPLLIERGLPFYAQTHAFNWLDIGTVPDYWAGVQDILQGKLPGLDIPGTEIKPGVWVGLNTRIDWENTVIEGPVCIGSGCHIESGCKITGPAWIGHGSHLRTGAIVERSILFEYTRIPLYAHLNEVTVFKDYMVDHRGETRKSSRNTMDVWSNALDRRMRPRTEPKHGVEGDKEIENATS